MHFLNKDVTRLETNGDHQKFEGKNVFFLSLRAIRQLYFAQAKIDARNTELKLLELEIELNISFEKVLPENP